MMLCRRPVSVFSMASELRNGAYGDKGRLKIFKMTWSTPKRCRGERREFSASNAAVLNCDQEENKATISNGIVSKQYQELVAQNVIIDDPSQRNAVRLLDALGSKLLEYRAKKQLLEKRAGYSTARNDSDALPVLSWFGSLFGNDGKVTKGGKGDSGLKAPVGMYVYGGPGSGKTFTMELFYNSLPGSSKRRVHFNEFMLQVHRTLFSLRKRGVKSDAMMDECVSSLSEDGMALCFDEFQVTDIADAVILRRLFEALLDRGVTIILTSNRPPKELYKNGIQRELFLPFIHDIENRFEVVNVESDVDYRLLSVDELASKSFDRSQSTENISSSGLEGETDYHGAYFACNRKGVSQAAAYERLYDKLTGGAVVNDLFLQVQGRKIEVPEAARDDDVARFSFQTLCGQPRGAADYYAIASSFHTVFVDDVPKLQLNMLNAIRRFITMVDIFYDQKVMLVLCSAVEMNELLDLQGVKNEDDTEGVKAIGLAEVDVIGDSALVQTRGNVDEVFAFSRTVSRLHEMNRGDYLLHHQRRTETAEPSPVRFFSQLGSCSTHRGMKEQDIKHLWDRYDKNKNKLIDSEELSMMLEEITLFTSGHRHVPDEVYNATKKALLPDGDDQISWERFKDYFTEYGITVRG